MKALRSKIVLLFLVLISYVLMLDYRITGISLLLFTTYLIGILFGVSQGRKLEKNRAMALCHQCLQQVWSGSVRRVLNGIAEDRITLLSEDEFFGLPSGVSSVQAPDGSQE